MHLRFRLLIAKWVGVLGGFGMRNRSTSSKWPKSSTSLIVLGGV
jgi:hypothetical protein